MANEGRLANVHEDILKALAEPFPPDAITWKPGPTTKDGKKCMAMPYGDLRAYMERLDAICGLDWSVTYEPWGEDRIIAKLTIAGVTRASTGEMAAGDVSRGLGGTVAEAQSFKRAAAMFGLGRFLYTLPQIWAEFDREKKRITDAGQKELDARYKAWYQRIVQTSPQKPQEAPHGDVDGNPATDTTEPPQPSVEAPDNPFADKPAADVIASWSNPADAQKWAIDIGANENKHDAREAFKRAIKAVTGNTTVKATELQEVYIWFYNDRLEKLQLDAAEKVAA